MPIFNVQVTRIGYATKSIEVEADDQEQANMLALDSAGGEEFSEGDVDYELTDAVDPRDEKLKVLLAALKDLLGDAPDTHEVNGRYECRHCGREWSAMCGDNEVPKNCPSDDCPGFIARAAIAKAEGRSV